MGNWRGGGGGVTRECGVVRVKVFTAGAGDNSMLSEVYNDTARTNSSLVAHHLGVVTLTKECLPRAEQWSPTS